MTSHVASISSSTNYHLRNIARIRRFIDKDTCKQAVRALITSRLDYCNSLLINITAKNIKKLQRIQNRSARLIFLANRRDNTSPLIKELHWLPVKERILFKTVPACLQMSQQPGTHLSHWTLADLHSLSQFTLWTWSTSACIQQNFHYVWGLCLPECCPASMEQLTCRSEKIGHTCLL